MKQQKDFMYRNPHTEYTTISPMTIHIVYQTMSHRSAAKDDKTLKG